MNSAFIRFLIVAALALAAQAVDGAVTVATYNVENYNLSGRLVDGVYREEYPKPEKEKAALRQVIRAIAPDILAVQEMGAPPFLTELQRDLRSEGLALDHAFVLEAADPARHVAVLSKIPIKEVRRHTAVPIVLFGKKDLIKRGVLEMTYAMADGDLTLFVVHLKSRRTERKDDPDGAKQRELEAEAVRDLVLSRFPDPAKARFIVLGDFNDTRGSKPVQSLLKRGQKEIGELLRAADSRGETWTHHYRREDTYSRIDYLVLSHGLIGRVEGRRATVYDGQGVADASDHRPVYVRLELTPAK